MNIKELNIKGYEKVLEVQDEKSGLHAIISLNNTALGPALGGIRFYPYTSFEEGLRDALRLSKGMTYKSAISGLGLGGGKCVVFFDPKKPKPKALLKALAEAVNSLEGQYICAADYGCSKEDILELRKTTKYIVGVAHSKSSGDPAPFTAWGTIWGIEATLKKVFGDESAKGKNIIIQGLGNVGRIILDHFFWQGADISVADIDNSKVMEAITKYGVKPLPIDEVMYQPCDLFVPCATGGLFSYETIPFLKCRAIAGCANNQLLSDEDAFRLGQKGVVYAPDFVINAGGVINVSYELEPGGYEPKKAREKIQSIKETLDMIYKISSQNLSSTHVAATALAEYRLKYAIGKRSSKVHFPEFTAIGV